MRCPPFRYYGKSPIPAEFIEVDRQAREILTKSKLSNVGTPALSTGDGNCLFNSVSTVLTGDEKLTAVLRLRTAKEMSLNPDLYKDRTVFDELMDCCPSYEDSLIDACTDGAYMSVWNMIALSTVVGNPIQSIYPTLNGEKDKTPRYLSKLFQTEETSCNEKITDAEAARGQLTILFHFSNSSQQNSYRHPRMFQNKESVHQSLEVQSHVQLKWADPTE